MNKENNKSFDPADMPQPEVFKRKEVYQHPQPADEGRPLKEEQQKRVLQKGKEEEKASKQEGLNEEMSEGNAGAFEGFEDQNKND